MSDKQPTIISIQSAAEGESVSPSVAPIAKELEMLFNNLNSGQKRSAC